MAAYPNEDRDPARGFSMNTQPAAPQPNGIVYAPNRGAPPPASPGADAINAIPGDAAAAAVLALAGKKKAPPPQVIAQPSNPAAAAAGIIEQANQPPGAQTTPLARPSPVGPALAKAADTVGTGAIDGGNVLAGAARGFFPETSNVLSQATDDVSTLAGRGDLAGATGAAVRGAAASIPAWVADVGSHTLVPTMKSIGGFYSGLTGDAIAPTAAGTTPASSPVPPGSPAAAAPVASLPGTASDNRLGLAEQGMHAAVAASPTGADVAGATGVSKTVDGAGKVTYSNAGGFSPNAGQPSARNIAAADALDARYAGEAAAINARGAAAPAGPAMSVVPVNALGFRTADQEPAATFDTKGLSRREIARLSVQTANNTANNATQVATHAATNATAQQGQQLQAAQAAERLALDKRNAGFSNASTAASTAHTAALTESALALNQAKMAHGAALASGDPKKIAAAEMQLRAAQGKWEKDNGRFVVVQGGTTLDPVSGQPVHQPSMVFNSDTQQFLAPPQQTGNVSAPKFESGKVYQDGSGNKAKWDGTKFVPV